MPVTLRRLRRRALPGLVVGVVALMGIGAIVGFFLDAGDRTQLREDRYAMRDVRIFQQALADAETGVRGFALTRRVEYLEPYSAGTRVLAEMGSAMLPRLDGFDAAGPPRERGTTPPSQVLAHLQEAWKATIDPASDQSPTPADAASPLPRSPADTALPLPWSPADTASLLRRSKDMMDALRSVIAGFVADRNAAAEVAEQRIAIEQGLLLVIYPLGSLIAIIATSFAFWRSARDARASETAGHEMEQLFGMASMLQSATDRDDANEVLRGKAQYLLPGFSGALYVFNNSRDRLDLATSWGSVAPQSADPIAPSDCWALKLGKPHINGGRASLACRHQALGRVVLEIPMAARGEIYGLLQIAREADDAEDCLDSVRPLAVALADAMSLSLSGSVLRDQLRNQALRDGLTGLYNRRFLEEMLDRLTQDAERRAVPMSAIMIDLDHFKRLNDQHGHSAGDAMLREVSRIVMASLRVTDIGCRYGGEELLVLLPDCSLENAVEAADRMRLQIESLSNVASGQSVTASFGVACTPDTTAQANQLVAVADAALYQAKRLGRNRVEVAARRTPGPSVVALATVASAG
jgi:diguanylate cyclase (GGDEF)-like protein